jgi:hypothetical protein
VEPFDKDLLDASSRMREAVNMHVVAVNELGRNHPGYIAIRLEDGRSPDNNTLYDDRRDVFRHNSERGVMAVRVGHDSMGAKEAITVLQLNRKAFLNGVVFADEEPLTVQRQELNAKYIPNTVRKLS